MTAKVLYLRQMLQGLLAENSRMTVRDFARNTYRVYDLLNSGNNALLNSFVYFDPNSKEIIPVDQPGEFQPFPINSWVQATGGAYHNGPKVVLPPPGGARPANHYLYVIS